MTAQDFKYLLLRPEPNKFWHQEAPVTVGSLFRKPHSVYHKSVGEDLIGLQTLLTDLVGLIIDAVMYASVKGFEIDLSQVLDPEDIRRGIYPGVTVKKRGFMNTQAVKEIITAGVPNQALLLLQFLDRAFQEGSGVTEYVGGLPTRRGRQTASEVLTKTQESYKLLEHIARGLEQQVIVRVIRQLYVNCIQYGRDDLYPGLKRLYEPKIWDQWSRMSSRERLGAMWGEFEFEVTGLSGFVARAQELERLQALIGVLLSYGKLLPQAGKVPNIPYLVDRITTLMGFNPGKIFLHEADPMVAAAKIVAMGTQINPQQTPPLEGGETVPAKGAGGKPPRTPAAGR